MIRAQGGNADVEHADRSLNRRRYGLAVLSGVMLGFSFPPSTFGILACFGIVPLLIVLSGIDRLRTALKFSYVAMLVFHVITLNWTGGYAHGNDPYMMIAGGLTMTLHPLFYFLPLGSYHLVRKHLGDRSALIALPFLWVGYEYSHSLSEWSFPWLTIGNSQSYDVSRIQFISVTGVLGLSLWILIFNVIVFLLYTSLSRRRVRRVSRVSYAWFGALLVLYVLPSVHGILTLSGTADNPAGEKTVTVGMIQANVDPWEKWNADGFRAVALYMGLTKELLSRYPQPPPQLIVWPETAIPIYLLAPANRSLLKDLRGEIDSLGVPLLTGLPHAVLYTDSTKAPRSAKRSSFSGERYDSYNAAAFFQPGVDDVPWYGKMKMVPLAERIPYADMFAFLDFMRWGVGIGGWQVGRDTVVFTERRTGSKFASLICYESVYPEFVASFVRKGAEFIVIITIDSWWDRMSGAFQHQQFAIFRAVENRRWIARCAVGGISCYIDPYGRVLDKTELFTKATLSRTITRQESLTFFTRHGDVVGGGSLFIAVLFVVAATGQKFIGRNRKGT